MLVQLVQGRVVVGNFCHCRGFLFFDCIPTSSDNLQPTCFFYQKNMITAEANTKIIEKGRQIAFLRPLTSANLLLYQKDMIILKANTGKQKGKKCIPMSSDNLQPTCSFYQRYIICETNKTN